MVGQPSRRFTATLERAYRRACRVGITEVGTDLVFYELATELLALDGLLPHALHRLWRPARKGRADLTDPRPSTVLHEVFLAEDVRFEADAVLRQAAFAGSSSVRVRSNRKGVRPSLPVFSPAVRHAVYEAIDEASRRGVEHAGPRHLLPALLAVSENAAARLAAQWVPAHELEQIALGNRGDQASETAPGWAVDALITWRLSHTVGPRLWRAPWRAAIWTLNEALFRRPYRRYGARYGHPLLGLIETNATEKAVRSGQDRVTTSHVMLSLVEFHEELASAGKALPDDVTRWSQAGPVLATHGVQARPAVLVAAGLPAAPSDAEDQLAGVPTKGWLPPAAGFAAPAQGRTAPEKQGWRVVRHRLGQQCRRGST